MTPTNDKEVFDLFQADADTPLSLDFITYAIFSFEKYQWHMHFEAMNARPPTQVETDGWIAQLTAFRFSGMREEAARFFDAAAREYLREEMQADRERAVASSIVAEVRAAGAWWRQLAIALATSILAPIIIGGMIAAALTYDRTAPTPTDLSRRLAPPAGPENSR